LTNAMLGRSSTYALPDGFQLLFRTVEAPLSLQKQTGDHNLQSLEMVVTAPDKQLFLLRVFHGIYRHGRNVCYYKPSERKSGDVWRDKYMNPKTKREQRYSIYGGKLTGILTQSFCREVFFWVLHDVQTWVASYPNVDLIG